MCVCVCVCVYYYSTYNKAVREVCVCVYCSIPAIRNHVFYFFLGLPTCRFLNKHWGVSTHAHSLHLIIAFCFE